MRMPDLFQKAMWFLSPLPGQNLNEGLIAEFAGWIDPIGARIAMLPAEEHDRLCAWISHVPQMISTALAAALVEEFGAEAPLLPAGGRALQEMTRIAASPYSMWRDVAISNQRICRMRCGRWSRARRISGRTWRRGSWRMSLSRRTSLRKTYGKNLA